MNCKLIKLSTGESIIAYILSETSLYVEVYRAIKILMTPRSENSYAILMVKWDVAMDFKLPVKVFKTAIVSVGELDSQFEKSYLDLYEEYDLENNFLEDKVEFKTVEDLAGEVDRLMEKITNSANNTLH